MQTFILFRRAYWLELDLFNLNFQFYANSFQKEKQFLRFISNLSSKTEMSNIAMAKPISEMFVK